MCKNVHSDIKSPVLGFPKETEPIRYIYVYVCVHITYMYYNI